MGPLEQPFLTVIITVGTGILSGILGFLLGSYRQFREEKHKAYRELLPPIIRAAYYPEPKDEKELNEAKARMWLYSNQKVAKKLNLAISRMIDASRGDKTQAFQEAIIEMRKDLRLGFWQGLSAKDVAHIYTLIPSREPKPRSDTSRMPTSG